VIGASHILRPPDAEELHGECMHGDYSTRGNMSGR
jgi:hypothetical protein